MIRVTLCTYTYINLNTSLLPIMQRIMFLYNKSHFLNASAQFTFKVR